MSKFPSPPPPWSLGDEERVGSEHEEIKRTALSLSPSLSLLHRSLEESQAGRGAGTKLTVDR